MRASLHRAARVCRAALAMAAVAGVVAVSPLANATEILFGPNASIDAAAVATAGGDRVDVARLNTTFRGAGEVVLFDAAADEVRVVSTVEAARPGFFADGRSLVAVLSAAQYAVREAPPFDQVFRVFYSAGAFERVQLSAHGLTTIVAYGGEPVGGMPGARGCDDSPCPDEATCVEDYPRHVCECPEGTKYVDDACVAACGDGVVDDGEECDEGDANSDALADACRTDCLNPFCGDEVVDEGEACEPALDASCAFDCTFSLADDTFDAGSDAGDAGSDAGSDVGAPDTGDDTNGEDTTVNDSGQPGDAVLADSNGEDTTGSGAGPSGGSSGGCATAPTRRSPLTLGLTLLAFAALRRRR